tara:strand:+ start:829 stop:1131 length:303 start_codon:yes stop_codon:yes gene_type:complete
MALQINTPIKTAEGFEVSNAYARVLVIDNFRGLTLDSAIEAYVSEADFLAGAQQLSLNIAVSVNTPYDRSTMSTDILDLAHDNMIAKLADQGIAATKLLS